MGRLVLGLLLAALVVTFLTGCGSGYGGGGGGGGGSTGRTTTTGGY